MFLWICKISCTRSARGQASKTRAQVSCSPAPKNTNPFPSRSPHRAAQTVQKKQPEQLPYGHVYKALLVTASLLSKHPPPSFVSATTQHCGCSQSETVSHAGTQVPLTHANPSTHSPVSHTSPSFLVLFTSVFSPPDPPPQANKKHRQSCVKPTRNWRSK